MAESQFYRAAIPRKTADADAKQHGIKIGWSVASIFRRSRPKRSRLADPRRGDWAHAFGSRSRRCSTRTIPNSTRDQQAPAYMVGTALSTRRLFDELRRFENVYRLWFSSPSVMTSNAPSVITPKTGQWLSLENRPTDDLDTTGTQ
jgi:hypothetical protein